MTFLPIYIYFFVPIVILLAFFPNYKNINRYFSNQFIVFMLFFCIYLILFTRDISSMYDMSTYSYLYENSINFSYIFEAYHGNIFFTFLMYLGNFIGLDNNTFFMILPILYLSIFYKGLKLIFSNQKYIILSFALFSISTTFILLFTNVIRQGLALSLLILAIGYILHNKKNKGIFVLFLGVFSHFSIIPIIIFLFFAKYLQSKEIQLRYLLILPLLPVVGYLLLGYISSFGGLFTKIQAFDVYGYKNNIVYLKVLILYLFLIIFYLYGKKYQKFNDFRYKYIFNIYLLSLSLVLFSLPVLLLSSRFLYYTSALMPILISFIYYSKYNLFSIHTRYLVLVSTSIMYGIFIYNHPSIVNQLGI